MPQNTELRRVSANPDRGVCAQDFETTIQPYVSARHLRGLLNFSALWNQVTYIYDTAIGDNPNLFKSYWAPPGSPENALYATFREFVEGGIVRCLVRNKVSVDGSNLTSDPTISDLYSGWRHRDGENTANFLTQEFGRNRDRYNQHIDRLLFENYPGAIVRYDPDIAKPRFREIVREELSNKGILWQLVCKLPADLRYEYERTCAEKRFMTTVDLWTLVKEYANRSQPAKDLLLMQGYVNQQAIAKSIDGGVAGSDWGHPWRPALPDQQSAVATTPADVLDQADLTLTAPAIELLALLSPSDIKDLRQVAATTLFNVSVPEDADSDTVRSATVDAMKTYWREVCRSIDHKFPKHTRVKTDVLCFYENRVLEFKHHINRSPGWLREAVSVLVDFTIRTQAPPGTTGAGKKILRRVSYRLLYKPTPALKELEGIKSTLWKPKAAWTTFPDK